MNEAMKKIETIGASMTRRNRSYERLSTLDYCLIVLLGLPAFGMAFFLLYASVDGQYHATQTEITVVSALVLIITVISIIWYKRRRGFKDFMKTKNAELRLLVEEIYRERIQELGFPEEHETHDDVLTSVSESGEITVKSFDAIWNENKYNADAALKEISELEIKDAGTLLTTEELISPAQNGDASLILQSKLGMENAQVISCPICCQIISRYATSCPHCGHPINPVKPQKSYGWIGKLIAVIIIVLMLGFISILLMGMYSTMVMYSMF